MLYLRVNCTKKIGFRHDIKTLEISENTLWNFTEKANDIIFGNVNIKYIIHTHSVFKGYAHWLQEFILVSPYSLLDMPRVEIHVERS